MTDKALQACMRYVAISDEIRQLGRDIGNALCACHGVIDETPFGDVRRERSHLQDWYAWNSRRYSDFDWEARTLDCEFCKQAHELIEKRKAARRSLGRAKAEITKIGRKAA